MPQVPLPSLHPSPPAPPAPRNPDPTEISYTAYSPSPSSLAAWREKKHVVQSWARGVDVAPHAGGRALRPVARDADMTLTSAAAPTPAPALTLGSLGQSVGVGSADWSETSASSGTAPTELVERRRRERAAERERAWAHAHGGADSNTRQLAGDVAAGQAALSQATDNRSLPTARPPTAPPLVPNLGPHAPAPPRPAKTPPVPLLAKPPLALGLAAPLASPDHPSPGPGHTRAAREAYIASALSLPLDILSEVSDVSPRASRRDLGPDAGGRDRLRTPAARSNTTLASAASTSRRAKTKSSLERVKSASQPSPGSDTTVVAAAKWPLPPSTAPRGTNESFLKPPTATNLHSGRQASIRAPPPQSEATVVKAAQVPAPPSTATVIQATRVPVPPSSATIVQAARVPVPPSTATTTQAALSPMPPTVAAASNISLADEPAAKSQYRPPATMATLDLATRVPIPPTTATVQRAPRIPVSASTATVKQAARAPLPLSTAASPLARTRRTAEIESDALSPVHAFEPVNIALPPSLTSRAGSAAISRLPQTAKTHNTAEPDLPAPPLPLPPAPSKVAAAPPQTSNLLPPAQPASTLSPRKPLHRVPLPLPRPAITPANSSSSVNLLIPPGMDANGQPDHSGPASRSLSRKNRGGSTATLQTRFEPAMYPLPPSASEGTGHPETPKATHAASQTPAAEATAPSPLQPQPTPLSDRPIIAPVPTRSFAGLRRSVLAPEPIITDRPIPVLRSPPVSEPPVSEPPLSEPPLSELPLPPVPIATHSSGTVSAPATVRQHGHLQFSPSSSSVADLRATDEHVSFEVPSGSRGRLRVSLAWVPTRANRARRSATASQTTTPLTSPRPLPPPKPPSMAPSKPPHPEPPREPKSLRPPSDEPNKDTQSPPVSPDRLWYGPQFPQPFLPPYAQQVYNASTPFGFPQPPWPSAYRPPSPLESPRRPPSVDPPDDDPAPPQVPTYGPGFGMAYDPRTFGNPNWTTRLRGVFARPEGQQTFLPHQSQAGAGESRGDVLSNQAPSVRQPMYHAPTMMPPMAHPSTAPPPHAPTVAYPNGPTVYGLPPRKQPSMFDRLLLRRRIEDEYEYARRPREGERPLTARYPATPYVDGAANARLAARDGRPPPAPYASGELARSRSRGAERAPQDKSARQPGQPPTPRQGSSQWWRARVEQDRLKDERARERAATRVAKEQRRAARRAEREARERTRQERAVARERSRRDAEVRGNSRRDPAPTGWAARARTIAAPVRALGTDRTRAPRPPQTQGQWTRILSVVQGPRAGRSDEYRALGGGGTRTQMNRETRRQAEGGTRQGASGAYGANIGRSGSRLERKERGGREGAGQRGRDAAQRSRGTPARGQERLADGGLWGVLRRLVDS